MPTINLKGLFQPAHVTPNSTFRSRSGGSRLVYVLWSVSLGCLLAGSLLLEAIRVSSLPTFIGGSAVSLRLAAGGGMGGPLMALGDHFLELGRLLTVFGG